MSEASENTAEQRRAARAKWPARLVGLDDLSSNIADTTTPTERLAMMWELAVQAWRVAGIPIPDYDRANIPSRIIRPGDPEASVGAD